MHLGLIEESTSLGVLTGQEAAAAFLDPPYNVPARNIGGRGQFKHENFAFASGEMTRPEFVRFLIGALEQAARAVAPDCWKASVITRHPMLCSSTGAF